MSKNMKRGMLITIALVIVVYWLYVTYIRTTFEVALLTEIPAEAASFVAYCQDNNETTDHYYYDAAMGRTHRDDIALYRVYDDDNYRKTFYLWFSGGYQPVNFDVDTYIDIEIGWERGAPTEEPQLYRIIIDNDRQYLPIVDFHEDGGTILPRYYNQQLK